MTTVEESIDVAVPVRTAYDAWTQFERFPDFMEGVAEIKQLDDVTVHWVAEFGGSRHEWNAEITEQHPDERVAWRNTDGKENAGVVTFHRLGDSETRVMVQLDWAPEGLKEKLGAALGADDRRVRGDLERFKQLVEREGAAARGWRGEVRQDPTR
ncbi:SRPBCC family protein [Conexibacter sp. JD483]|uniref:SRPBCC family protein n=1 Tax=unclassified Conexibacter TaxID=2627773 RepID=UPI00271C1D2B|nr:MULTISPECIES: SRPBCC family protein [unclassified Conexibacter]MDO8186183.1 SRPBCC family protein [Conexibacter sp. CPCC 205706]MDO8199750.1 SRPBCC family protein [Conexibacter sp. CPCC 205762]MDR9368158.1 SRPBCC family protein [Conexibacter sp. JD483]